MPAGNTDSSVIDTSSAINHGNAGIISATDGNRTCIISNSTTISISTDSPAAGNGNGTAFINKAAAGTDIETKGTCPIDGNGARILNTSGTGFDCIVWNTCSARTLSRTDNKSTGINNISAGVLNSYGITTRKINSPWVGNIAVFDGDTSIVRGILTGKSNGSIVGNVKVAALNCRSIIRTCHLYFTGIC